MRRGSSAGGRRASPVRGYLLLVGALLLGQGAASLLVRATGRSPHATNGALSDPRHALIHVAWGVVLLVLWMRARDERSSGAVALVFGLFYLGLFVLGLVVHHPFGLVIDAPENAFHAIVGSLGLALGMVALARPAGSLRDPTRAT